MEPLEVAAHGTQSSALMRSRAGLTSVPVTADLRTIDVDLTADGDHRYPRDSSLSFGSQAGLAALQFYGVLINRVLQGAKYVVGRATGHRCTLHKIGSNFGPSFVEVTITPYDKGFDSYEGFD